MSWKPMWELEYWYERKLETRAKEIEANKLAIKKALIQRDIILNKEIYTASTVIPVQISKSYSGGIIDVIYAMQALANLANTAVTCVHHNIRFAVDKDTNIQKKYKQLNEILEFTTTLINEKQIKAIVIGLPEGKLAENTKKFGEKLKLTTKLPVYYQDETLSTHQAKIKMIQAHKPQKKRRFDHKIAATIILQDYLDDLPKH